MPSTADGTTRLEEAGDAVLISRGGHHRCVMLDCPCGCRSSLPINVDPRSGPAWRLYSPGPMLTLYPSVWRESGCNSHFVVRRGQVIHMMSGRPYGHASLDDLALQRRIRPLLTTHPIHFSELAELLGEEPWDVLEACVALERLGGAREERIAGIGGMFRAE